MNREDIVSYFKVTDLWKRLCERHSVLLEVTQKEYLSLLENDIDKLLEVVEEKEKVIQEISELDKLRREVIADIGNTHGTELKSYSELFTLMKDIQPEQEHKFLQGFNELLINIIEKIKKQNRANQIFVNKSLISLKSLKEEALE